MKYVSTRGHPESVDFIAAAMAGLAPDGGLYCPLEYPQIEPPKLGDSYVTTATRVLSAFAGDAIPSATIEKLVERAYEPFAHKSVAPLVEVGPGRWMLELHHGPTLAFKDIAMRLIAQLYDYILSERGERMTILCATSGDTGGAAASAFAGAKAVDVVILHPHNRVSPTQRIFMTSTGASNIHNLALEGDFDGTQAILKSLIGDAQFKQRTNLAAVNSINWARVAAQSVYFAQAQAQLGADEPITFVVPTGNFGDAFAGYVASRCGLLPEYRCVSAVNENDAMARFFEGKPIARRETVATLSPAMDIQVPSNFERLLFEAMKRDGQAIADVYSAVAVSGEGALPLGAVEGLTSTGVRAERVNDDQTLAEMKRTFSETGWMVCPHTAVGMAASRRLGAVPGPVVMLATAHPAKFPETVREALDLDCALPVRCESASGAGEQFEVGPMSETFVRERVEAISTR